MDTFRQIISNSGIDMLIGEGEDIEVSGFYFSFVIKPTSSVALISYQYFELQQFTRAGNSNTKAD